MRHFFPGLVCCCFYLASAAVADAREWSSPDGRYRVEAEAIAFDDKTVVLKKPTGQLLAVELAELSPADQDYVKSREAKEAYAQSVDQMQTWTADDGMKVRGRILAYGRKDLTVRRQLGKMIVNDKRFAAMDPLHQKITLTIISKLVGQEIEDEKAFEEWGKTLRADTRTFPLEGVLMKLESGDEIGVPFFLFAEEEQELLQPGWKTWLESESNSEAQQRESLMLQTQAMEYQRDRQNRNQIEALKLGLLATATGVVSIWEVILEPAQGNYYRRTSVMVPAQNSAAAEQMVLQKHPGFRVVGVRRASR
ncbi:SHD1 domain-containing protein [Aporhodopirellula aestuarii]|uniref:SHD1 domain-containing protein n=1 Tax=Aporhodopirellula aestuarii TaxID=2950107 RepID=A0ABT0U5G1_9BACT|nr:SHD1 domain-containing protein [Aporhodopirellula aestuarii]MCM2372155.1 SHD1 domain-containing protein [Aporhodopirellula aestuarii]